MPFSEQIIFDFFIDRGGTFTDVYANYKKSDKTFELTTKLLSSDPANYQDAPREGIRRIIEKITGLDLADKFPASTDNYLINNISMGTTIATNALLERKGEPCALLLSTGFKDLLEIAYQNRPKIFDLNIKKPEQVYKRVVEIEERVVPSENGFEILKTLNEEQVREELLYLKAEGIRNIAVVFMHSYAFKDHEQRVAQIAREMNFNNISLSSVIMPMQKIVARGDTTAIDAYLTPLIKNYIDNFKSGFSDELENTDLFFIKSDAALVDARDFLGSRAILSGPAGGVVGYSSLSKEEFGEDQAVIGFDMGGTSTDVSRFQKDFHITYETELDGLRIQSPQIDIKTVAAGGGSKLTFKNGMLQVGPDSVGSHPGPVCYKKGGELAVTDANLLLGRLVPNFFPKIFGPNADEELDLEATKKAFVDFKNKYSEFLPEADMSVEDIAEGFLKVANEAMARPIREITLMQGHDISEHVLTCFGGAGAQHACAIAKTLGVSRIFIHKFSGILSAYGISKAELAYDIQESVSLELEQKTQIQAKVLQLEAQAVAKLQEKNYQGISTKLYLNLRYEGTSNSYLLPLNDSEIDKQFSAFYKQTFGFSLDRKIYVDDIRVKAYVENTRKSDLQFESKKSEQGLELKAKQMTKIYAESKWHDAPVYLFEDLNLDTKINGPAIVVQDSSTIVVDLDCVLKLNEKGNVIIHVDLVNAKNKEANIVANNKIDPIKLAIFSSLFMSVAEQMGRSLQRTAVSTNIKERLDFSCAIFDAKGNLIANAPHQPVHLGAMGEAVKAQISLNDKTAIKSGDVFMTNHPSTGGSHLPDITLVSPVFQDDEIVFFTANRGHHADIGGISPGSMPSFSRELIEEGISIKSFKVCEQGVLQEQALKDLLLKPQTKISSQGKKISGTRTLDDNLSDLKAQIAANQKGIDLVQDMITKYGYEQVDFYMQAIQQNAEQSVRTLLKNFAKNKLEFQAEDFMDDGSVIKLKVSINPRQGSALFDFSGSSKQLDINLNAPRAVTNSAVLYALRCMIQEEIPLNQGCLNPIKIVIPGASMLSPDDKAAVVGGNVLTSQRIVDVIFKAFNFVAASQGCMNNLTFGDESFGYYETIGGGSGAGPNFHGSDGVHTHMTNTRITDPEILETRYPVRLLNFSVRKNSGGAGEFKGGDGLQRTIEFLKPLTVSLLTERRKNKPYGLNGGKDGAAGRNILLQKNDDPDKETLIELDSRDEINVNTGDILTILTPGGGGCGEALKGQ